jgi:tungstate transport system substrate-binding protein
VRGLRVFRETAAPPVFGKERDKAEETRLSLGGFYSVWVKEGRSMSGGSMKRKTVLGIVLVAMLAVSLATVGMGCGKGEPTSLVLATTSSTQDSGLLDKLLPVFEEKYNVKVKTVAVGSGEALAMGKAGDADVLMVHAPASEEELVKNGYGLERVKFMFNDFVIVGPDADPAAVKGDKSAVDAFKRIAAAGAAGTAVFVSRADDSGTHKAELKIWKEAGIEPKGQTWYVETGQGMGETLTIANEKKAYTLADRATYLARKGSVQLVILVEGDKMLYNQYSVIVVNPEEHKDLELNVKNAGDLVEFVTSEEGQEIIRNYKKYDTVLFHPNAEGETRGMGDFKE